MTERAQTERALRERLELQDQLAKIAASVPGAIFTFRQRPDGRTTMPFATPAVEDLYGIPRAALSRDTGPFFAAVHPSDRAAVEESLRASAATMTRLGECMVDPFMNPVVLAAYMCVMGSCGADCGL